MAAVVYTVPLYISSRMQCSTTICTVESQLSNFSHLNESGIWTPKIQ